MRATGLGKGDIPHLWHIPQRTGKSGCLPTPPESPRLVLLSAFARHMAFCLALACLSAAAVRVMIAVRVLDVPDARRAHARPTPKGGGVGVVMAFLVGIFVLYQYAAFSRIADPYFRGVILASAAIAIVAFLDDLRDWPFVVKLGAQLVAALVAIGSGLYVSSVRIPGFGAYELGWLGPPATLAWILFATNAMNFIDGLNGLASGVALIACGFLAYIAAEQSGWFVYFAALLLAAGLAGFLPFNFPRARIFMGDVGSQFCGFVLAVLAVAASRFGRVEMSFILVPMLLFGVMFDVAFTLVRRLASRQHVTKPHRGHLYQVAHRAGMPATVVTLVHWGFTVFGGVCCLVFISASTTLKTFMPAVPLVPQFIWVGVVAWQAHRARMSAW
jgi:UDP-GlcNAc:undecaprenyl-phosphate GlcNAc-1-phosphate transferase